MSDETLSRIATTHRDTEAKLKLGILVAGFGIGSIDYVGGTIVLDELAAAILELPAGFAIPRSDVHSQFHPESADAIWACIAAAMDPAGSGFMMAEHRLLFPDGRARWVKVRKQVEFAVLEAGGARQAVTGLLAIRDISDRKGAEEKLRISEIRYRRLFEAAHDGVLLVDPLTAKIVDANPFMTELLGYTHEELVGKELFEIGLLGDQAASQDMVAKLSRNHDVRYENLPLETVSGLHRDVEVVANLYDEGGHSIIQCNIRDITARKLAEATLLQNTNLFAALIEQAPNGVYVIDAHFRIFQVNRLALPAFKHIVPLIGRDFAEVLEITWGVEVGTHIGDIFRNTLSTGSRYVSPAFKERRHDLGIMQSYEWEIQRVTLADGQYGVVCYFKDVTELRKAEEAVLEREAHVRSILDNTQAFIGLMDVDGTVLEVNTAALTAAGVKREDVIGKKLWGSGGLWTQVPEEEVRLRTAVERAAQGETVRYDMILHSGDNARTDIDFMLAPVRDAGGTITFLVPSGLDITERRKSLDHIRLLMGEVNHRAMNLLGVVLAVARQTLRAGDPATFVARLTDRITGLAASQDLLVQNDWQGVDVADLARAQLAHYRDRFGTQVEISGPPARLTAAAAQGIGMALHELATNAGKHGSLSTGGGHVLVSWYVSGTPAIFEMTWTETGGPVVATPTRRGFGQKVIGPMVEAAINGTAVLDYAAGGVSWTLTAPAAGTLERGRAIASTSHATR
jgi:PAS domain S-box-containing protein